MQITRQNFPQLYHQHERSIRSVLLYYAKNEEQLSDMVQETFIKLWKTRHQFNNHSKLTTWLYRIAINCALDHLRKQKRHNNSTELNDNLVAKSHLEQSVSNQQLLQVALRSLDEKYRQVILLHIIEGQSLDEIAQILSIPQGTVKSRIHTAKAQLTTFLQRHGVQL